jgi:hypothetical protein
MDTVEELTSRRTFTILITLFTVGAFLLSLATVVVSEETDRRERAFERRWRQQYQQTTGAGGLPPPPPRPKQVPDRRSTPLSAPKQLSAADGWVIRNGGTRIPVFLVAQAPRDAFPLVAAQGPYKLVPSVTDNGTRWSYDAVNGWLVVENALVDGTCQGGDGNGPLRVWQDNFVFDPEFSLDTRAPATSSSMFRLDVDPRNPQRRRILFTADEGIELALTARRVDSSGSMYALWASGADDDDVNQWWLFLDC